MEQTVSEKQLAANRANALKSTGPKTQGGKHNSSGNGFPFSFNTLANGVVLPTESRAQFFKSLSDLINEFQPIDPYELDLVKTMAVARWRTLRGWTLESAAMAHEQRLQAGKHAGEAPPVRAVMAFDRLSNQPRSLEALSLREMRYDRAYHRAADRLLRLREKREKLQKTSPQEHYMIENKEEEPNHEPIFDGHEPSSNPARTGHEPSANPDNPSVGSAQPETGECAILNKDKKSPSSC